MDYRRLLMSRVVPGQFDDADASDSESIDLKTSREQDGVLFEDLHNVSEKTGEGEMEEEEEEEEEGGAGRGGAAAEQKEMGVMVSAETPALLRGWEETCGSSEPIPHRPGLTGQRGC